MASNDSAPLYNDKGELVDRNSAEGIRLSYRRKKELEQEQPLPKMTPEFSEKEIESFYPTKFGSEITVQVYAIAHLPESMKEWVLKAYPGTQYVNMGPWMGEPNGMLWMMWGWNSYPKTSSDEGADWRRMIRGVNPPAPPAPPSETKKQLESIAATLQQLTETVAKLAESTA
jgi:hypothetical protein